LGYERLDVVEAHRVRLDEVTRALGGRAYGLRPQARTERSRGPDGDAGLRGREHVFGNSGRIRRHAVAGDGVIGRHHDQRARRRRARVECQDAVDRHIQHAERPGNGEEVVAGVASGHDGALVGSSKVRDRPRRCVVGGPALSDDDVIEGEALGPAVALKAGVGRPLVRPAEAEPAERLDAFGQVEQVGKVVGPEKGHPTHA
jgi:hypothetical protein